MTATVDAVLLGVGPRLLLLNDVIIVSIPLVYFCKAHNIFLQMTSCSPIYLLMTNNLSQVPAVLKNYTRTTYEVDAHTRLLAVLSATT